MARVNNTIEIISLSSDGLSNPTPTGKAIIAGHLLGIQDIVSNHWYDNLLSDNVTPISKSYPLKLTTFHSNGDPQAAMEYAIFESVQSICKDGKITSPIFLGCPWSALSVDTAKIFNIFPALQISSSATAPILSQYESFFRLIASDTLQAKALVQLCVKYGWNKVGVIYINDAYGEGLRAAIDEEALEHDIVVQAMSYDSTESMEKAARFIKENELYINILIVRDTDIKQFLDTRDEHGLIGYPYFYIGVDSWFEEVEFERNDIIDYVKGWIGTIPGSILRLTRDQYRQLFESIQSDYLEVYDVALDKQHRIIETTNLSNPHNAINYGYDASFTIAHALRIFSEHYSLEEMLSDCSDVRNLKELQAKLKPIRDIFRDILINNVSFIGATGSVSFDESGDREGQFFLYGYAKPDGSIGIFGAYSDNDHLIDEPEWPSYFNGNVPQSHYDVVNNQSIADAGVISGVVESVIWSASTIILMIICTLIVGLKCCLSNKKINHPQNADNNKRESSMGDPENELMVIPIVNADNDTESQDRTITNTATSSERNTLSPPNSPTKYSHDLDSDHILGQTQSRDSSVHAT